MGWAKRTRDSRNVRLHLTFPEAGSEGHWQLWSDRDKGRRQEVYDGRGQAGETLLSTPYPEHPPGWRISSRGMWRCTAAPHPCPARRKKGLVSGGTALSASLFMPIAATSVCPSSQMPWLLGSPGTWPMWYLESSTGPFLRAWSAKAQEEWSNVSLQGLSALWGYFCLDELMYRRVILKVGI